VLAGIANQPVTIASDAPFNYLQQSLLGHYGSDPEHVEQLVALARLRRIDLSASVREVLPLSEAEQAVRRVQTKQGNPTRVILRP
jgi:threonine dehydrogenase-like Zn-dependent dehydrogenase